MNIRILALSAVVLGLLSSCNTISGIGKDISSMGNSLDNAATTTSRAMDQH
ncbi:MAG: entericidin [Akkermansia sp.]|nr:entericidin [Akkermansia sp.]